MVGELILGLSLVSDPGRAVAQQTFTITVLVKDAAANPPSPITNASFNFPIVSQFNPGSYLISVNPSQIQNPYSFYINCSAPGFQPQSVLWQSPPTPPSVQCNMSASSAAGGGSNIEQAPVLNVSLSGNTVTATATIPQPPSVNYALLIVWGDNGTNSQTMAYNNPSGTETHTYANPGVYEIQAFTEYGSTDAASFITGVNIVQGAFAIKTSDGKHYLTAVNGGGLGEPSGVALNTNAQTASTWETLKIIILSGGPFFDSPNTTFALQTSGGDYVTAVNGGGVGGPNNASSPIHTDATSVGAWEKFTFNGSIVSGPSGPYLSPVTIQAPSGNYLTAVNGGGVGGPNNVPIHTDATTAGSWETFSVVPAGS
jgi:hypothetical protein